MDKPFILNVAAAPAFSHSARATLIDFEPDDGEWPDTGVNIQIMQPGQPNCRYHSEPVQEDFLVLHGECIAIVDGEERPLRQWDLLHCPAGTEHVFVGAGDGPCAVLMIGSRREDGRALPGQRGRGEVRRVRDEGDRRARGGLRRLAAGAAPPGGEPLAAGLMARVLAYTSPARGHLFPVAPILEELLGRGHDVALRTLASEVEPMRARGFDAAPIDPAIERIPHDDHRARTPLGAQKRAVRVFCRRAEHETEDLRRAIDDLRPDVLLVDVAAWGALAAAEAWGGAWASWCPYPLPVPSRDTPPFGPGFRPAHGVAGRLRDAVLGPILFGSLERIVTPRVNEVRGRVGVPPVRGAADLFLAAPLLLYLTAEPFEYPRSDWPANVRLVGPCDWDPPADPPAWLDEVEAPIVLVTTSSEFQDDGRLVRCALEALAGEPVHVVATLPSGDPAAFDAPANARVLPFVPHGPILDRAACAITHGGMGATQKALARGVPVCAVPFGRDQLEVARRVEVAGAGTRLTARRLSPARLRAAVQGAIRRADGARRVAEGYREAGGAVAAADAVDVLIGAPALRS